jgi:phosphoglycolate phosphatase-like HAD superfamily hydrolase
VSRRFAVLLLDVDGTLVSAGGAGRRAIQRALQDVTGAADPLRGIALDGMTDRLIVREAFGLLGRAFDDATCDAVLARYLGHLTVELAGFPGGSAPPAPIAPSLPKGGSGPHPGSRDHSSTGPESATAPAERGFAVLPGVEALLAALAGRGAAYGLCTGNVVDGARQKLARGGLDRFFEWHSEAIGGFGHDGEAREKVVAAAVARASARLGRAVPAGECLVVGDTPRDVEAARRVGCPSLAVATGRFGVEALAASGADRAVPTLDHPDALDWLL